MIILLHFGQNQGHVLASNYPELAEQWNYDRNGALTPWDVTIGSGKKVWWKCSLGHEWEAVVGDRARNNSGCPYCANRKAWPGFNDLASQRPAVAAEWNTEKNGALTPQMVTVRTERKVWWTCALGHEWEMSVRHRTRECLGCPICSHRKLLKGYNDLATTDPEKAAEWDYEKNGDLTPGDVFTQSHKKAWWICRKGHPSFNAKIFKKKPGLGCPLCRAAAAGERLSKPVVRYSLNGEVLRTYKSGREAARVEGLAPTTVQVNCIGGRERIGDSVYRYRDQPPREKPPVPEEERLRDVLNQVVSVGDEVMFIKYFPRIAPKTLRGTVTEITKQSVLIRDVSGDDSRIMASRDDPVFLQKVLVMRPRPERPGEGDMDASGYPMREGDPVVYMALLVGNKCKGFEFSTVKKAGGKRWEVNGSRRTSDRMIVVNW